MAFLTLFRIATGDNWNGIMKARNRTNKGVWVANQDWTSIICIFGASPVRASSKWGVVVFVHDF